MFLFVIVCVRKGLGNVHVNKKKQKGALIYFSTSDIVLEISLSPKTFFVALILSLTIGDQPLNREKYLGLTSITIVLVFVVLLCMILDLKLSAVLLFINGVTLSRF